MFTILETIVDDALANTHFACDLGACAGACCTMPGGRGAPLLDSEVEEIEEATPAALRYLSERNRTELELNGGVEGRPGDYSTPCIDNRDCLFVYYEGEVAKCAIERAYFNGETTFRKPISCHLFPIRIHDLFDSTFLHYEKISQCRPALTRGRADGVKLYIFLKEALVRAFGEEFYDELVRSIESR